MPDFFAQPVLNSPYEYPRRHWELDEDNQPTQNIEESRRKVSFITPIPRSRRGNARPDQTELTLDEGAGLSDEGQDYDLTSIINEVRSQVDTWRKLAKSQWNVTAETASPSTSPPSPPPVPGHFQTHLTKIVVCHPSDTR